MKKYLVAVAIVLVLAITCGDLAAQITATKPPNSKITMGGPQAHQPPGGRQPMTGTIYGFVYWDATITSHLGSSACNSMSITVAVASKSPYSPFGAIGTQSHFTPIATVHPPVLSVNTTSYDGCAYSYTNAPLGQNLYVKLNLTQAIGQLTPTVVAQDPAVGPIQFSSTPCNKLPPLTKATVAALTASWGSCQNVAYDVNLPLVSTHLPQLKPLSASGGSGGNQGGSPSGPLLNQTRPAGMLNNAPPPNTHGSPNSQPRTPGQLLPAKPGGGGTVQLNPQPYPPKGTTSTPGPSGGTSRSKSVYECEGNCVQSCTASGEKDCGKICHRRCGSNS